jgi:hypothetical protein
VLAKSFGIHHEGHKGHEGKAKALMETIASLPAGVFTRLFIPHFIPKL